MKQILSTLLIVAFMSLAGNLEAQKIGTIDLKKAFDGYWKTKQADKKLKEREEGFRTARGTMVEEYESANASYRGLIEEANDQNFSEDERSRRKKNAETKILDIREIENSIKQFDQQAYATVEDQKKRARNDIVREISELVITIAKRDRFSLVLDTSGNSMNLSPVVLYTDGSNDITDEVLKMLNANAPKG